MSTIHYRQPSCGVCQRVGGSVGRWQYDCETIEMVNSAANGRVADNFGHYPVIIADATVGKKHADTDRPFGALRVELS